MGMGFQFEKHRLGLWDLSWDLKKNNFLGNGISTPLHDPQYYYDHRSVIMCIPTYHKTFACHCACARQCYFEIFYWFEIALGYCRQAGIQISQTITGITRTKKYEHIKPVLKQLHWLPVNQRINYKILLLTYKALNGQAPSYITELLEPIHQLGIWDSPLKTS